MDGSTTKITLNKLVEDMNIWLWNITSIADNDYDGKSVYKRDYEVRDAIRQELVKGELDRFLSLYVANGNTLMLGSITLKFKRKGVAVGYGYKRRREMYVVNIRIDKDPDNLADKELEEIAEFLTEKSEAEKAKKEQERTNEKVKLEYALYKHSITCEEVKELFRLVSRVGSEVCDV